MTAKSTTQSFFLSALLSVSLITIVVLGYGYWHARTHASFHIDMHLLTGPGEKPQDMPNAEITFLDESGKVLALGVSDEKSNFVRLLHPEAGDCHEAAKEAPSSKESRATWQKCFAQQSTWIPKWAKKVNQVDVLYKNKRFEKIPVTVSEYNSEWFLWWVPLPHVGGKPYTYFRATITVDAGGMDL